MKEQVIRHMFIAIHKYIMASNKLVIDSHSIKQYEFQLREVFAN